MPDNRPVPDPLKPFWDSTVRQFTMLEPPDLDDGAKERHRIFSLLLCAGSRSSPPACLCSTRYGGRGAPHRV